ncbi:hypothetical protein GCM10011409_39350 [Lentibacillus populi]|uniref:Uncharacterized protein n=1 Tax=Lentibacillus populi TaxID=1827502 RepID=A0A9W5U1N1_9BACI|nr:hypothetical protein [Lentibacillus populi]MBT2215527.1 hypothetical protein [Virgibacillus dakarensis]GGB57985.1 hypothetical protein GCM10011409_39350 [Lentibacillus populi]
MKKPRCLWLRISLTVVLVLVLGDGTYAFSIYNNAKQTVNDKVHKTVSSIDQGVGKKKAAEL